MTEGDNSHCYFLQYSNGTGGSAYEDMIKVEFLTKVNNGGNNFEWKYSDSYPYSLLMNLTAYPFPGLVGLPHYGDWNAEFVKPALVYFEKYGKRILGTTTQIIRSRLLIMIKMEMSSSSNRSITRTEAEFTTHS